LFAAEGGGEIFFSRARGKKKGEVDHSKKRGTIETKKKKVFSGKESTFTTKGNN